MSTAAQHGAAVVVIVANNGKYGTIRMHQEKTYPGRVSGTALTNPDFAAFAELCGGLGLRVSAAEDVDSALRQALAAEGPALVEIMTDPELI